MQETPIFDALNTEGIFPSDQEVIDVSVDEDTPPTSQVDIIEPDLEPDPDESAWEDDPAAEGEGDDIPAADEPNDDSFSDSDDYSEFAAAPEVIEDDLDTWTAQTDDGVEAPAVYADPISEEGDDLSDNEEWHETTKNDTGGFDDDGNDLDEETVPMLDLSKDESPWD